MARVLPTISEEVSWLSCLAGSVMLVLVGATVEMGFAESCGALMAVVFVMVPLVVVPWGRMAKPEANSRKVRMRVILVVRDMFAGVFRQNDWAWVPFCR